MPVTRLLVERRRLGLNQAQIADKAGLPRQWYGEAERGVRVLSPSKRRILAELFSTEEKELFSETGLSQTVK